MPDQIDRELHGVSNVSLKLGLWYVRHKILLENILIGVIIAIIVGIYTFNIWSAVRLFVYDQVDHAQVMQNIIGNYIDHAGLIERYKPDNLQVGNLTILPASEKTVNVVASLTNPNDDYIARPVQYRVVSDSLTLGTGETHIWNNQSKYIAVFGLPRDQTQSEVRLEITHIGWDREPSFTSRLNEKHRFTVSGSAFVLPESGDSVFPVARFNVINETIFNFWEVGFYVILLNGSQVVGVGYTTIPQFRSLESHTVELGIPTPVSLVTSVEVIPEVDILDSSIFFTDLAPDQSRPVGTGGE